MSSAIAASSAASSKPKKGCCHGKQGAAPAKCPAHLGTDEELVIDDHAEAKRLRRAMRDGVFLPWTELGRAPTPAEIGQRLKLGTEETEHLLEEMQDCGENARGGILRVPTSELIVIAWPFANVPTGIIVTLEGGKPASARCAVDALGVSKMLGKPAVVEAETRDGGVKAKIVVDGDRLVSFTPATLVVVKGDQCDTMSFFSSAEAAERWRKENGGEGKLLALADAVHYGAETFGRLTNGL